MRIALCNPSYRSIAWAARARVRQVAPGTQRELVQTVRDISAMIDAISEEFLGETTRGVETRSTMRRMRLNPIVKSARRMAITNKRVRRSRRCWRGEREENRSSGRCTNFEQTSGIQVLQKREQVAFATLGLNVIFPQDYLANFPNGARCGEQCPDPCARGV